MRSHLLSVAAFALLSVFVVVSTPCHAEGDETGHQSTQVDPTQLPANTDPAQTTAPPPADTTDAAATIEEVEGEEVPASEE